MLLYSSPLEQHGWSFITQKSQTTTLTQVSVHVGVRFMMDILVVSMKTALCHKRIHGAMQDSGHLLNQFLPIVVGAAAHSSITAVLIRVLCS